MSLATRCPSCETVFRMTTQEATARGGTVRCGVCGTVFNALDALVNLDRLRVPTATSPSDPVSAEEEQMPDSATVAAAPASQPPVSDARPDAEHADLEPSLQTAPATPAAADQVEDAAAIEPVASSTAESMAEVAPAPLAESNADALVEPASEPVIESSFADTLTEVSQNEVRPEVSPGPPASVTDALLLSPRSKTDEPAGKPGRRRLSVSLLVSLSALALLLLAAQAVYVWRDALAANWPATRPLLAKACVLAGCRVELPMNIAVLSIESSELQAVPQTTNSYSFNTLLRNRGTQPLRHPALELTLTDTLDQPVLRRVILPAQYLNPAQRTQMANGIAPNAELPIRIRFDVAGAAIVGYRVGIFYP